MTQPIILPSGKIIDQKTLDKHAQNEAVWGRPASDPFTGIRFNNTVKPIAALPLKARIDKFLVENSNREEIKKLPRVLGSKECHKLKYSDIITCSSESLTLSNNSTLKRALPKETFNVSSNPFDVNFYHKKLLKTMDTEKLQNFSTVQIKKNSSNADTVNYLSRLKRFSTNTVVSSKKINKPFYGHSLPLVVASKSSNSRNKPTENFNSSTLTEVEIATNNATIQKKLDLSTHINLMPQCKCCKNSIFYKLPCEHIICRKALMLLRKNECTDCHTEFKNSDPQRYHLTLNS